MFPGASPKGPAPDEWLGVDLGGRSTSPPTPDGNIQSGKAVPGDPSAEPAASQAPSVEAEPSLPGAWPANTAARNPGSPDVNHVDQRGKIVREGAEGTGRGIKLADLSGIRDRTLPGLQALSAMTRTPGASASSARSSPTRQALHGVNVRLVDPANTSRNAGVRPHQRSGTARSGTCSGRERCGLAGPADHIAARNVPGRAAVTQPDAARSFQPVRTCGSASPGLQPCGVWRTPTTVGVLPPRTDDPDRPKRNQDGAGPTGAAARPTDNVGPFI